MKYSCDNTVSYGMPAELTFKFSVSIAYFEKEYVCECIQRKILFFFSFLILDKY